MPVTIYEDVGGGGEYGDFPDPAEAKYLWNYSLDFFNTWDDQISSLKTTTPLKVFELPGFAEDNYTGYGTSVVLPPGFHDLASLEAYDIGNDSISSFFALA
jgi:hypothetical protein